MRFEEKLLTAQQRNNSWLCIGLDIQLAKMPLPLRQVDDPMLPFARAIMDATQDLVCAFKPNLGFFLAEGAAGVIALERLVRYIPPDIPVILDAKFGDIGSTAEQYARGAFEAFHVDAVTLSPYVGADAIKPFLAYEGKGAFVLARTSNPGAGEFQNLIVEHGAESVQRMALYEAVVQRAVEWHRQGPGTCGLVVGATYPQELEEIRRLAPGLPFLVPGVGAQSGDLAAAVRHGPTSDGIGPIISASRSILYASGKADYAEAASVAASKLRDEINLLRNARSVEHNSDV
jgi:orotidine-5'-phosphate decarboxylase